MNFYDIRLKAIPQEIYKFLFAKTPLKSEMAKVYDVLYVYIYIYIYIYIHVKPNPWTYTNIYMKSELNLLRSMKRNVLL